MARWICGTTAGAIPNTSGKSDYRSKPDPALGRWGQKTGLIGCFYGRIKRLNRCGTGAAVTPIRFDHPRAAIAPRSRQRHGGGILRASLSGASHGFPRRLCRTGSDGVRVWIRSGSGKIVLLVDTDASVRAGQSDLPLVSKSDPVLPSRPQSSRSSERSRIVAWFQPESVCRSPSLAPLQIVPRFRSKVSVPRSFFENEVGFMVVSHVSPKPSRT